MSRAPLTSQLLQELAHLPPADPRRAELHAQIQLMPPEDRDYWLQILQETDLLYAQATRPTVPPGLQEKLLALPDQPPAPWWKEAGNVQLGWKSLAACALIGIGIITYLFWPPPPPGPRELSQSVAWPISRLAVSRQEAQPPLEVAGGDAGQVQTALSARGFSFPVMVLQPRVPLTLLGGGVCDFGPAPAVFTRWAGNGLTYTLYQFDGRKLGVPDRFLRTTEVPTQLWHDDLRYRVVIWPGRGAPCAWALVMQNDAAIDAFSQSY